MVFRTGQVPDVEQIRQEIGQIIDSRRYEAVQVVKNYYKTIKYTTDLVITGESVDLPKKLETLTTLYQSMVQAGDPRADKVLNRIMAISGENYDAIAGQLPPQQGQGAAQQAQQAFQATGNAPQGVSKEVANASNQPL